MKPERGDRTIVVTRDDVTRAARQVGIEPGDTVMFHSSLSSMGTVQHGPDTVIDGFLDAVGPEGTVAVPTLCNWAPDEQERVFERWNPTSSPSYVGAITEAFRRRPEAVRSDHATHSVAAIGARAVELTADHGTRGFRHGPFGNRAFAEVSPWERFYRWNAAYCFIGVTFQVNTMVHYVESLIVQRALDRLPPETRQRKAADVRGWMKPGIWPDFRVTDREIIEKILAEKGLLQTATIGSATLRCARAQTMVDEWIAIAEAHPQTWWPEDFITWWKDIQSIK